jgi:hypothetical protein
MAEQEEDTWGSGERQALLSELSRHYDSTLWHVTSIWAAAIGGLLVFCIQDFDPWLATLGLFFTAFPMFFAKRFRELRYRVHRRLLPELAALHVSGAKVRQWDAFGLIFLLLALSWTRLLISKSGKLSILWIVLTLIVVLMIYSQWKSSRNATRLDDP